MRYVIGIDEAGRGALAGPIAVGVVLAPEDFYWQEVFALVTKKGEPRLRDSKQLSVQQRQILFDRIAQHGSLRHAVAFVDASTIDSIGIVNAANEAAAIAVSSLGLSSERIVALLDAGLRLPSSWKQQSFVRGDETIPSIALASIVAKVARDHLMEELSEQFDMYQFAEHKGYGTLTHRQAIRSHGLSELHRVSFCTKLLVASC